MYWHARTEKEVCDEFQTNIEQGLSSAQVQQLLDQHGENVLQEKAGKSLFVRFLSQFKDFMVIVLMVAAVVSAFLGEGVDALVILAVIILNAILGTLQENKAEKALDALKKLTVPTAKVRRNGKVMSINSQQLVPGDIILLEAGDVVPADARIVECANLQVEESSLTGESIPVEKTKAVIEKEDTQLGDRINMVFTSGTVTYGRAVAIVCATGMDTQVGHIADMLMDTNDTVTPLQIRLTQIGKFLSVMTMIVCTIVFGIGLLQGREMIEIFMTAVSLAVAAIPEGLPAIVTIVLAISVERMVKENAIIRKLPAVETLGCASVICSDKTGTLTQNKMTVTEVYTNSEFCTIDIEHQYAIKGLLVFSALCTDAVIEETPEGNNFIGDPTETAIVAAAKRMGIEKSALSGVLPRCAEIPFESDRKLMTTIHNKEDGYLVVTKGAPDILIGRCTEMQMGSEVILMGDAQKKQAMEANNALADKALRVLAVGVKQISVLPENLSSQDIENDLIFVGLIGMIDPPRDEVRDAVKLCKSAGIRPVMITGDHVATAVAIAKNLGILDEGGEAITGAHLSKMSDDELYQNIRKYSVYARVSPEHKVRIVQAWQRAGEIVAMTGDGVNDAPALKNADIGCAMGITGTDVAKSAAHMVLTDDKFTTIVTAVREGRGIYNNIHRACEFLMSANLSEVFTIVTAIACNWATPLLPVQMLWINLVTDSFPGIALGMEPVDPMVMEDKPRPKNENFFTKSFIVRIVAQGAMIGSLTLFAFWLGSVSGFFHTQSVDIGRTMAFCVLALSELVHAFNVRSKYSLFKIGFHTNKFMLYATLSSIAMQVAIVEIPFFHNLFKLADIGFEHWAWIIAMSLMPIVFVEIYKLFKNRKNKKNHEE